MQSILATRSCWEGKKCSFLATLPPRSPSPEEETKASDQPCASTHVLSPQCCSPCASIWGHFQQSALTYWVVSRWSTSLSTFFQSLAPAKGVFPSFWIWQLYCCLVFGFSATLLLTVPPTNRIWSSCLIQDSSIDHVSYWSSPLIVPPTDHN